MEFNANFRTVILRHNTEEIMTNWCYDEGLLCTLSFSFPKIESHSQKIPLFSGPQTQLLRHGVGGGGFKVWRGFINFSKCIKELTCKTFCLIFAWTKLSNISTSFNPPLAWTKDIGQLSNTPPPLIKNQTNHCL